MAVNSIAFLNMIECRMAKPFMCLLMSEAIEAIVKVKRKNDCNFFKDCAMAMWIVMAFYFPFIHWLVPQRLRDYLWHKSGDWNSLFTHCLRRHKKRSCAICVTPWFSMWTSQGLNLGPPDYESVKVRFFKISRNIFLPSIWLFIRYLITLQPK